MNSINIPSRLAMKEKTIDVWTLCRKISGSFLYFLSRTLIGPSIISLFSVFRFSSDFSHTNRRIASRRVTYSQRNKNFLTFIYTVSTTVLEFTSRVFGLLLFLLSARMMGNTLCAVCSWRRNEKTRESRPVGIQRCEKLQSKGTWLKGWYDASASAPAL